MTIPHRYIGKSPITLPGVGTVEPDEVKDIPEQLATSLFGDPAWERVEPTPAPKPRRSTKPAPEPTPDPVEETD